MERLKALLSGVENSMPLTDADKSFIRKEYEAVLSKKLSTKSGCKDCWRDAIIEILSFGRKSINMRNGDLIFVEGKCYSKLNVTLEIMNKHLKEFPNDKYRFKL